MAFGWQRHGNGPWPGRKPVPIRSRVHRASSNFKSWPRGTHRSGRAGHLQACPDEFTFRHNRRTTPMISFQRLLGLESHHAPRPCDRSPTKGPTPPNKPDQTEYTLPNLWCSGVAAVDGPPRHSITKKMSGWRRHDSSLLALFQERVERRWGKGSAPFLDPGVPRAPHATDTVDQY